MDLPPDSRQDRIWYVLPWLLLAGVTVAELVEGVGEFTNLRTGALLSPVPALAAIRGSPRTVAVVSGVTLAVALLTATFGAHKGVSYQTAILGSVVVVSVASVLASVTRERGRARLHQVQRVAEATQLVLLPSVPTWAGEVRLEARYVAAESEARIGGDLYEVVIATDHTRLIIGDVRGKGLPAVRTAAAVLGTFREAAHHELRLSTVATRCSEAVERLERSGAGDFAGAAQADELFVTAVLVEIEGPVLRLVNLGHPPPVLIGRRGPTRHLETEDTLPPLGLAHHYLRTFPYQTWFWEPGDKLLLYTDGIDEARDAEGRFFPLLRSVESLRDVPVDELPDRLLRAVDRHSGERLGDDAAIVAAQWRASGNGEPVRSPAAAVEPALRRGRGRTARGRASGGAARGR